MPRGKSHGPSVKDDRQYEKLRESGMSKGKAARIANTKGSSRKGGKSPSYDEWTKDDLLEKARQLDISGRSSMSKGELVKALRSTS